MRLQNLTTTSIRCTRVSIYRLLGCASLLLIAVGCGRGGINASVSGGNSYDLSDKVAISTVPVTVELRDEPIRPLVKPEQTSFAKIELGRKLFNDKRLSGDNSVSCASCHNVSEGGDDGLTVSVGIRQQKGELNAPTVLNSSLSIAQFWDGRAANLKEQVRHPIHNPIEMDSNWDDTIQKLSDDRDLVAEFRQVYKQEPSTENITDAIAAYESALITVNSPFDRYLCGDDDAISKAALNGYKLFKSVGCISCHQGQAVGGNMFQEFGVMRVFGDRFDASKTANLGRINATNRKVDRHRFKVPGLRNVEHTAPYFHDGSAKTLAEAISTMAEFQLGEELTDEEVAEIRAFLKSLSGEIRKELL